MAYFKVRQRLGLELGIASEINKGNSKKESPRNLCYFVINPKNMITKEIYEPSNVSLEIHQY